VSGPLHGRYDEVKISVEHRGTCAVCGKRGNRGRTFAQLLHPSNKSADGTPKGRRQIMQENAENATKWQAQQFYHAKCEPKKPNQEQNHDIK